MSLIRRREALAALVLPLAAPAVFAQSAYPSKVIQIIVPFPPGGSTDLLARRLGDKLAAVFKQPVVVENRPGAGGTIGATALAKAAPDGHTLMMGVTGSNAIGPALYPKLAYDAVKDFAPISMASVSPLMLAVSPKLGVKTLEEFVALAKSQPGKVSHGTPGNGTSMHLTAKMFEIATGTDLLHVPYKGSAAVLTDLLAGQINAMFNDVQVLMQQVKAGKAVPLAVSSLQRHPMLPDVPTMAEKGYAGFEALSWQGMFAPAGTPQPVLDVLNREINKALASPDIQEYFGPSGLIVTGNSQAEWTGFVHKEIRKWADLVRQSGVKLE